MQLYVINLDRSIDRLAHVTTIFGELGLEFTRVSGVDGRNLSDEEFTRWTRERKWSLALTRPEVGCFLSHRACLIKGVGSGEPYFAIFEDDVLLAPGIAQFLNNHDWIKPDTDIVKLDTAGIRCMLEPLHTTGIKPYRTGRLISTHYCAGGYIVSRSAAERLLAVTEQAFAPIDEIYFNPKCDILQTLNVQQVVPAPVIQAGLVSTIRSPLREERRRPKKPLSQLPCRMAREAQRFYRRCVRLFWWGWVRRYRWGEIPFG